MKHKAMLPDDDRFRIEEDVNCVFSPRTSQCHVHFNNLYFKMNKDNLDDIHDAACIGLAFWHKELINIDPKLDTSIIRLKIEAQIDTYVLLTTSKNMDDFEFFPYVDDTNERVKLLFENCFTKRISGHA